MAVLDDVRTYLRAQGSTASGYPIFLGYLPATTGRAIAVTEIATPNTMGHDDASLDTKRFQVRVRGPKISTANAYSTGEAKLAAIRVLLESIGNETMGARRYTHIVSTMSSAPLGLDDNQQPHFVQTFSTLRSKTT